MWVFAPSISNISAPTVPEIDAGTVLTEPGSTDSAGIAAVSGFAMSNAPIGVPDAASTFDKQIPGIDSTESSSITFYDDDASSTKRTALAKGTSGFIIRMPYGSGSGKRCEVWPVRTTGVNDDADIVNASGAATFTVGFAVEDTPDQEAVTP
jgi:hypothetical protein